jgi:hypothetical protein
VSGGDQEDVPGALGGAVRLSVSLLKRCKTKTASKPGVLVPLPG